MLKKAKVFRECTPPEGLNTSYLRIALDGRYNAKGGHDPFATTWYDYKSMTPFGTRHDGTNLRQVTFNPLNWTEQGYRFDGQLGIFMDKESCISGYKGEFMIEIMFEPNVKSTGTLLSFGLYNNGSLGTARLDSYVNNAANRRMTFEYRLNGKKIEYYKNGILISSAESRYLLVSAFPTTPNGQGFLQRIKATTESGVGLPSLTTVHQASGSGSAYNFRNLRIGYNQSGGNFLDNCVINSIRLHKFTTQTDYDYGYTGESFNGTPIWSNGRITYTNQSDILSERFPI
jgi:hypothetical protein